MEFKAVEPGTTGLVLILDKCLCSPFLLPNPQNQGWNSCHVACCVEIENNYCWGNVGNGAHLSLWLSLINCGKIPSLRLQPWVFVSILSSNGKRILINKPEFVMQESSTWGTVKEKRQNLGSDHEYWSDFTESKEWFVFLGSG